MLERERHRRLTREGRSTGERVERDGPERVDVAAPVDVGAGLRLLGAHVARRADDQCSGGIDLGLRGLGDAEVRQVGLALVVEQDVGRLDIAMDEPVLVGGIEGLGHALEHRSELAGGDRPSSICE